MNLLKVGLYNLLILIALLLIMEVFFRVIKPNYSFYERTYPEQYSDRPHPDISWLKKDLDLGWVCKTSQSIQFPNKHYADKKIDYNINSQGFRNSSNLDSLPSKRNKKRLLLLGDSFVFGVYLHDFETIEAQLKKELGNEYEIYNLGIPGWGIDQMYMAYQKYVQKIDPDEIWLFYIDYDIYRCAESFRETEGMNKKSFMLKKDQIKVRDKEDGKPSYWKFFYQNSLILNRLYKIYSYRQGKKISAAVLNKMCDEKHPLNKVIRIPIIGDFNKGEPKNLSFKSLFKNKSVDYVELFEAMNNLPLETLNNLYLENDGHLTKEGSIFVVNEILK